MNWEEKTKEFLGLIQFCQNRPTPQWRQRGTVKKDLSNRAEQHRGSENSPLGLSVALAENHQPTPSRHGEREHVEHSSTSYTTDNDRRNTAFHLPNMQKS